MQVSTSGLFYLSTWFNTWTKILSVLFSPLFQDFFLNVKDILRKPEDMSPSAHNYHDLEQDLQEKWDSISYSFLDQYKILRNCLPTPNSKLTATYFSLKVKRVTGGGKGGQFTRISYQSPVFAISIFLHINSVHLSDELEILFLDSLLRKQRSTKLCVVRSVGSWFKESKFKTKLTLSIQGGQFKNWPDFGPLSVPN